MSDKCDLALWVDQHHVGDSFDAVRLNYCLEHFVGGITLVPFHLFLFHCLTPCLFVLVDAYGVYVDLVAIFLVYLTYDGDGGATRHTP